MSATHYLENAVLNHIFGGGDYTRSAQVEIGLSLTPVFEDGSGITEPGSGGYARVTVNNDTNTWEDALTVTQRGKKTNKIPFAFPEATGDWGTLNYFFITDGTNVLGFGMLETPRAVYTGDQVTFAAGDLQITLD